jgi:fatty acid-binding protein DegV
MRKEKEENRPFVITTDSGADIPLSARKNEYIINIPIFLKGVEDTPINICTRQLIACIRQGQTFATSVPTIYAYADFFERFVAKGLEVIHIGSIADNAELGAAAIREVYQGRSRITIVNSLNAGLGLGALYLAVHKKKQEEELNYAQVLSWINAHIDKVHCFMRLGDLDTLYRHRYISNMKRIFGKIVSAKYLAIAKRGKLCLVDSATGEMVKGTNKLVDLGTPFMNDETLKNGVLIGNANIEYDMKDTEKLEESLQRSMIKGTKTTILEVSPLSVLTNGTSELGYAFIGK